jgi:hypothetical protein
MQHKQQGKDSSSTRMSKASIIRRSGKASDSWERQYFGSTRGTGT